jgi:TPR repeat protein/tRNA A-37 threonylcarbamoyl transferase component Bud32
MSDVYEATHVRVPRKFAIKIISKEAAQVGEAVERFRREAEIASSLGNEHIVQVFDFNSTSDGRPYIAMERLEGEELATRIARKGRLTAAETARIVKQAAVALRAVHERGIVHRDLKPQNIFLCVRDDQDDFVKILDFGISKIRDVSTPATKTGWIFGTPNYMSPEQATGRHADIDLRTDIFSMGVIAYECLTGKLAFGAPTPVGTMYRVCHEEPPPLRSIAEDVPVELQAVIERAMAKDPAKRYPTVAQFAEEFSAACTLSNQGAVAKPADTQQPATKSCPFCAEVVPQSAATCSYCHETIDGVGRPPANEKDDDSGIGAPSAAGKPHSGRWETRVGVTVLVCGVLVFLFVYGSSTLSPGSAWHDDAVTLLGMVTLTFPLWLFLGLVLALRGRGKSYRLSLSIAGASSVLAAVIGFTYLAPRLSKNLICHCGGMTACNDLASFEEKAGNLVEAKRLYTKACNGGNMGGCFLLGTLEYQAGNLAEARRLFAKACDGGDMGGCFLLGTLEYQAGNLAEARRFYAKACDGGNMGGCNNLGVLEHQAGNLAEARRLYTKACNGGNMGGCFLLGTLEYQAGNLAEARRLYTKACKGGNMGGCNNLGALEYQAGNLAEARRLFTKACDGGDTGGYLWLGFLEHQAGNLAEARRFYAKACDGGDTGGCNSLRELEGNTGRRPVRPLGAKSVLGQKQGSTVDQTGSRPAPTIGTSLATASGTTTGLEPCSVATSSASGQDPPVQQAEKLLAERGESGVPAAKAGEAVAVLEEAARTDPACAEVWSLLAYARYRREYTPCSADEYGSAEEAARRALELARDDGTKAASLRNMGRILAARSRWAEARQQFEGSLKLAAKNREAQTWLEDVIIAGQGPRPGLLGAAGKAIRGDALDATELSGLTKAELRWVANAPLARQGRVLNRAPQDWFFFCNGSPLGTRAPATQKLIPATATDRANMKLAKQAMKAAPETLTPEIVEGRDTQAPQLAVPGATPSNNSTPAQEPGEADRDDPWETAPAPAQPSVVQEQQPRQTGNTTTERATLVRACDGGESHGCYDLGVLEDQAGNLVHAKHLFAKACDGGEMGGCNDLGFLEKQAGNLAIAKRLYVKACVGNEMRACTNLGALEKQAGNLAEARRLFTKACNRGEAVACGGLNALGGNANHR